MTSDAVFEKVFNEIQQEQQKPKKSKKEKKKEEPVIEYEEDEILESSEDEDEYISGDDNYIENNAAVYPEAPMQCESFLKTCWETLTPPVPESDLKNAWYAGIFVGLGKKKGVLYLGRVTQRFLKEENGPIDYMELSCLKPCASPSATVLEEPPVSLSPDIGLFHGFNIIAGPLQSVTYMKGRKWGYENYPLLYKYYKMVEKINLEELFKKHYI